MSKALKALETFGNLWIGYSTVKETYPEHYETIKQALIKAEKEHKVLEILTNKINIELNFINNSLYVGDYNSELSEEEFKILKEVL